MTKSDKFDVKHVSKLAKLTLTDEEVKNFGDQLSQVVEYIDQLKEVDTKGVVAISQTTGLKDKLREDSITPQNILTFKEATSGTENVHNDYFLVSALLKKK